MPETLTLTRRKPSWMARLRQQVRSYWTGPYTLQSITDKFFADTQPSTAGVNVSETTAFMCAAVWDAVSQIAGDIAALPLVFYKRRQDGGKEKFVASKLYKLLHDEPNGEMSAMVFRRVITLHALIYGNGFAEIQRDLGGRPIALWPIHPNRVRILRSGSRAPLQYEIDGGKAIIDSGDMLHLQGLGADGIQGFNLIAYAREALGLAMASEKFAASFFGNGTRFGGVLSSDQDLDPEQVVEIMKRIENLHKQADKAFRLLVLGAGFKFQDSGTTPNDAQMQQIRDQQVYEVARFFGIPPHKLKQLDRATNNNIEQQDLEYYKGCLLRWITLWEQELNRKLVPDLEYRLQFFKHNVDALLRGDITSRYTALGIARDKGIINADEWRELEDMNPQPNGQGQLYLVQSAQIPVDKLADLVDAQVAATKAKSEPPKAPTPPAQPPQQNGDPNAEAMAAAANARAERAEQLAAESAQRVQELTEALATANTEQTDAMRAELAKLVAVCETQTVLAHEARAEAEQLRIALTEREAKALELAEAKGAADAARDEAHQRVAAADAKLAEALVEMATATELASLAEQAKADAEQLAETLRAHAESATTDKATAEAKAAEAERLAAEQARDTASTREALTMAETLVSSLQADVEQRRIEAERLAATLEAETARLASELEQRSAETTEAIARAEATVVEIGTIRSQIERSESRGAELQSTVEALQRQIELMEATLSQTQTSHLTQLAELQIGLDRMQAELMAAQQAAQNEREQRELLATALAEHKTVERVKQERMIAAIRRSVVEAVGRMAHRASDKARKHQATPAKLRTWLEKDFAKLHEATCMEAFSVPVQAHLAWKGAADGLVDVATRELVTNHTNEFIGTIETALRAAPEDFHATLEQVLSRWDDEHAERVADIILADQIAYLRALDTQERSA